MGDSKAELVSLQQVRCVLAAIRTGSFTAASDALRVSQPAVAEQVRVLERTLGVPLFVRAGRGVHPTEAGMVFAEHAAAVLTSLEAAVDGVAAVGGLRTGALAFGLFATPEAYGLHRLASAFARRHPGLSIRLVGRNSSLAADRVRDGELEAALVTLPIDDAGLDIDPFVRDEVVYVSADRSHTATPATIELLTRRPLILYDAGSGDRDPLRRQLQERAQELGLRLTARLETETMVMALRLAADGVGDTYVPRAHTRAPDFPNALTVARFRPVVHETFAIVTRRGARLSPAMETFVADLRVHMLGLDPPLEAL